MKDMASLKLKNKATHPARSISLPSRSHPLTQKVQEQLCRLKQSTEATSSSTSIHNLAGLKELHDCLHDLLRSPVCQKVISRGRSHEKCVNEILEGSVMILDTSCVARDYLLQSKQCAQDIQSVLRRRRKHGFENEVGLYMASRKKVIKEIQKSLGDMRRMENKRNFSMLLEKEADDLVELVRILREVEAMSLSILESILAFLAGSRARSTKSSGWCLVAKLVNTKTVACEGEMSDNVNEMEKVDMSLSQLISNKFFGHTEANVAGAQKQLAALELSIHDVEAGLESVYKSFIQTRVSLLNILSQ